ncbi:MAG: rRNA m(7)G-527 methyltransferase [Proteobacteria bacterium]|nr:rRNA m(7)G-527 methyltransferase [Pseudomonadota bacterium]
MNRRILSDGLAAMGLPYSPATEEKLLAYLGLLLKWNKTYNLTAVRDPEQGLTHHLLDSLAILPWLNESNLLDVGSGGGLPGIPLAIVRPELAVTLVDAVQKKVSFLQQAVIELELPKVQAVHARVEALQGQFGQIVSRAFADLSDFVGLTRHLLAPDGCWLAMKGALPAAELSQLPAGIVAQEKVPLAVPGLKAERHLIILKAGS